MIVDTILEIVNKFVPDEDEARKAAVKLESEFTKQMELKHSIIKAELKNGSGLWRVRLMYLCMLIVTSQWIMYDVVPWLAVVFEFPQIIPREAPMNAEMWSFLKIGVGGYIGSRGVEKSVAWFKGGK